MTDLFFLGSLAAAFFLSGLGRGSLASWDEANYAVVSKLIVQTGDWIVLRWPGGGYFFDKPPLYMWLTAVGYKIFGIGEFATRLPSALGGVGLVVVTYLLGRRLFGRLAGLAGAGVLLSSTDILHYARFGSMDILQLFFFTAIILAHLETESRPAAWWWFWAASASCFMTKGPLLILAWAIVGVHFLSKRRRPRLRVPQFWLGACLFLALVLPWHVLAWQANPEGFWNEYFIKNYITRGGRVLDGHDGNAYFYIRVLINKYHPWIVLAPIALWMSVRRLRKSAEKSNEILLLSWLAIVFCFFTFLVKTKLNWYILPLHPALSILIGVCLAGWFKEREKWLKTIFVVVLVLHIPFSSVMRDDYTPGIRALAPVIQSRVPAYSAVYLYNYHEQPAALFYWDRSVLYIDSMSDLDRLLQDKNDIRLVVLAQEFEGRIPEFTRRGFHVVVRTETADKKLYLLETRLKKK